MFPRGSPLERVRRLWPVADGVVVGDLACSKCGYNLRTRREDEACTECGQPVRYSKPLAAADRRDLRRSRAACAWIVLILIASPFIYRAANAYLLSEFDLDRDEWRMPMNVGETVQRRSALIDVLFRCVGLLPDALAALPLLALAAPFRDQAVYAFHSRRVVFTLACLPFVNLAFECTRSLCYRLHSSFVFAAFDVLIVATGAILVLASARYIGDLARRIPRRGLVFGARGLYFLGVVFAAAYFAGAVLMCGWCWWNSDMYRAPWAEDARPWIVTTASGDPVYFVHNADWSTTMVTTAPAELFARGEEWAARRTSPTWTSYRAAWTTIGNCTWYAAWAWRIGVIIIASWLWLALRQVERDAQLWRQLHEPPRAAGPTLTE